MRKTVKHQHGRMHGPQLAARRERELQMYLDGKTTFAEIGRHFQLTTMCAFYDVRLAARAHGYEIRIERRLVPLAPEPDAAA